MKVVVDNVNKVYRVGENLVYALRGVSFEVSSGEFVSILGPSGSGKTTLLMIMAALIKPSEGRVLYDGTDVTKFSPDEAAFWRYKNIGFIFQLLNLIDFLDALENVIVPVIPYEHNADRWVEKAEDLLRRVGIGDRLHHKPWQMSVGQQQRVAIARALITDPKIVFADEPTAHLDTETGAKIVKLMKEISEEKKVTFIVSTHDPEIAKISDRIIKIRDGKIIEDTKTT